MTESIAAHIRPVDESRMSRLVLAVLDDDITRCNRVLAEANADTGVHLLVAALARSLAAAMASPALSDDGVRQVFERTVLDAQVGADDE